MDARRRFRFLKELAQGGFGKVYLAEMITGDNFRSVVAIKLLHTKWSSNDEIVMRTRDEARLLGRLNNSNIVRVQELTRINGQVAIIMEYLQGVDLKAACNYLKDQGKPFPRKAAFTAIGAVASALDAAYNHRPLQGGEPLCVIHRDIKPSNAIITIDGDVKVLDFGTARASFEEREAKTQVLAFGSQAYMAPERMLGEPDTPAADIFSLGITLYELLTLDSFGKIHLRQERYEPSLEEKLEAMPLESTVPAGRAEIIDCMRLMLAYEPTQRPAAAQVFELMEALADRATDLGVKRFARETVKEILENQVLEQDPNDPLTGAEVSEETSGVAEVRGGMTETLPPMSLEDVAGSADFRPPPELSEPMVDLPSSRPSAAVAAQAAFTGPPVPPRVTSASPRPPSAISTTATPRVDMNGAASRAEGSTGESVSAPRTRQEARETSRPMNRPSSSLGDPPAESSGSGNLVKAMIGIVVLALIAAVVVGGGAAVAIKTTTGPTDPTPPVIDPVPDGPKLPAGKSGMDWSANAAGKGGAILQVSTAASEVIVSSSMGYRTEWDGSLNLRVKDLEPGTYRGKVKPKGGGSSTLADFSVEAGKTCVYVFGAAGAWEKGECR